MTNEAIVALSIVALCLFSVCALCWRMTGGLHGHHILDARARERERRDYMQLVERLLEKRETPAVQQLDLAHAHRSERMQRTQVDANTEVATAKMPKALRPKTQKGTAPPVKRDALADAMFS